MSKLKIALSSLKKIKSDIANSLVGFGLLASYDDWKEYYTGLPQTTGDLTHLSLGLSDTCRERLYRVFEAQTTLLNEEYYTSYLYRYTTLIEARTKPAKDSLTYCFSDSQLLLCDEQDWSGISDLSYVFNNCFSLQNVERIVINPTTFQNAFYNCTALTTLDTSGWDTSSVTTFQNAFYNCTALTTLDTSGWDTSSVTTFQNAFDNCTALTTLDTSGWDTSSVTTFQNAFGNCTALTTLDTSGWDTSSVTTFRTTFAMCESLVNLDVSNWNVENVTDMGATFRSCTLLDFATLALTFPKTSKCTGHVSVFSKAITKGDWELEFTGMFATTSDMRYAFEYCYGLKSITFDIINATTAGTWAYAFQQCTALERFDIKEGNVKVTNLSYVFIDCKALETVDATHFDTSACTSLNTAFMGCASLSSIDVSGFNLSKCVNFESVFYGCRALGSIDVGNWDVSLGTNFKQAFRGCSSLTTIDVSKWNISSATTIRSMYYGCSSLTTLDVSSWDTSNVTDMGYLFNGCSSLTTLDVSSWDTSNVTDMGHLFNGCSSLTTLDVSSWDTSNVTDMGHLFNGCSSLTTLDVSSWDTSNVTDMGYLFNGCSSLTTLDVSSWDTSNVTDMTCLFLATAVTELDLSTWSFKAGCKIGRMFSATGSSNGNVTFDNDNLIKVKLPSIDLSQMNVSGWGSNGLFSSRRKLTTIEGELLNIDDNVARWLVVQYCPLDRATCLRLFEGLVEYTDGGTHTLQLSSTSKGYLTDEDYLAALLKGWSIS